MTRREKHAHIPHVYVVYWPGAGVLKVGITERARWDAWRSRGAREIACVTTCCMTHARTLERHLIAVLREQGATPAFTERNASRGILGDGVGWSECYHVTPEPSPVWDGYAEHDYDYAGAYGLDLPQPFIDAINRLEHSWFAASGVSV